MSIFLLDIWLDGYETDEEVEIASEVFIKEQLDFSASSISFLKLNRSVMVDALYYILGKYDLENKEEIKKYIEKIK